MTLSSSLPRRPPTPEEQALVTMALRPRRLVFAALIYATLAAALGVGMAWAPVGLTAVWWGKAHIHLFTIGFFTFLICGLSQHMLPRFSGRPLRTGWWAPAHEGLAHLGLWMQIGGWLVDLPLLTGWGAAVSLLAFLLFTWVVAPTLAHPA